MKPVMRTLVLSALFFIFSFEMIQGSQPDQSSFVELKEVSSFLNTKSAGEKQKILEKILASKDGKTLRAFYFLLNRSSAEEEEIFKKAFISAGTTEAIVESGKYIQEVLAEFVKIYDLANSSVSEDDKILSIKVFIGTFEEKINAITEAIIPVAKKNIQSLINLLKTEFASDRDDLDIGLFSGACLGLQVLGEDGFQTILDSVKTEDDELMMSMIVENLGYRTVIPILKMYENPASSEKQKRLAGILILSLPKNGAVLMKLVEAYKHGRYFDQNIPKNEKGEIILNVERMMSMVTTWWGNLVEKRFKGDTEAVDFIGENFLDDSQGQNKVINMMTSFDFGASVKWLKNLNLQRISPEVLASLFLACEVPRPSFSNPDEELYVDERYEFFCHLFTRSTVEQRKQRIFSLSKYPPAKVGKFVSKEFPNLSDDEKQTVIFMLGKNEDDILGEAFPIDVMLSTYKAILIFCNYEQKETILYVLKKRTGQLSIPPLR